MSDATLQDTFVMLCDWRGRCVWASVRSIPVTIGSFIWEQLVSDSQHVTQQALGRVVTLRDTQQIEVVDQHGDRYRAWLWPLDSPEVAVCVLAMRVPGNLNLLTERERECLGLLAQGLDTRLIAKRLDVSLSTIHTHLRRAREKLDLPSVEALISFAARYLFPVDRPLDARES